MAGSSPRVRGILGFSAGVHCKCRFIPACTGNTSCACRSAVLNPVHPRVYGEYLRRIQRTRYLFGSSPRVRGIHFRYRMNRFIIRFIPACTGNTLFCALVPVAASVHPRVYGEYNSTTARMMPIIGSSPRVRGILLRQVPRACLWRFIPACTGNTTCHG